MRPLLQHSHFAFDHLCSSVILKPDEMDRQIKIDTDTKNPATNTLP